MYVGNAATSLVTATSAHGIATLSLGGITQTLHLDGIVALAQRKPLATALLLALVALLGFLIRQAQRDAWREAGVLRSRAMMSMMAERAARTMTAESLRDDLRKLQAELGADTAWATLTSGQASGDLTERLARLTAISEMLSSEQAARAMWDALMEQQMAGWQRRQRLWSAGMGAVTIVIGGLLPIALGSVGLGLQFEDPCG